jgi:hypothetical protein
MPARVRRVRGRWTGRRTWPGATQRSSFQQQRAWPQAASVYGEPGQSGAPSLGRPQTWTSSTSVDQSSSVGGPSAAASGSASSSAGSLIAIADQN